MVLEKGICAGEWALEGGRCPRGGPHLATWVGNGDEILFLGHLCSVLKKDNADFKYL